MAPLICTTNSFGNADYGIPILARKSTDYRTSTGTYHKFIPNIAQEFAVCVVKARIKPELLVQDVAIRDERLKSLHSISYQGLVPTIEQKHDNYKKSNNCTNIHHIRPVQEQFTPDIDPFTLDTSYTELTACAANFSTSTALRLAGDIKRIKHIFQDPVPPMAPKLSEMKDSFPRHYTHYDRREVFPPEPYLLCKVEALGRDEQPAIRPEGKGFWKWMDPYMSTYTSTHIPFTKDQWNGVARKDIITYYDASELPKVKGFGPRGGPSVKPLLSLRTTPVFDKAVVTLKATERTIPPTLKRVPNMGMQSEYQGSFVHQSYSDMYPYLFQNGEEFGESLPQASPWQNLAAPGTYCTEYCHVGTGWPVRSIVDPGLEKRRIVHKPCHTTVCDGPQ